MSLEQMTVTRQEVEQELERKSASIAGSISRIRKDLSLPTEPVKSAIREHPLGVLIGTVAIGLACGWLVGGRRRKGSSPSGTQAHASEDLIASEFLHLVGTGKASGLSEKDAVARALRAQASLSGASRDGYRPTLTERLGDHFVDMADAVVRTALRVVMREAAGWLTEAVRRDKTPPSQ